MDDQAKHDLKWVGIWAATTLIFRPNRVLRPQRLVDRGARHWRLLVLLWRGEFHRVAGPRRAG